MQGGRTKLPFALLAAATVAAGLLVPGGPAGAGARRKVKPVPSAGCSTSDARKGEQLVTMASGGANRRYYRNVPRAHAKDKPAPVVVDLHGHSETARFHQSNSGLARFGDSHGFVTITPEGSGPPPRWDTNFGSPDVQFVADLLDDVEQSLCVDERRIFLTGFSNGAFLASTEACVLADRVAAVAPVAGVRDVPGCQPARAVPLVAFHGTGDEWIAFTGGLGPGPSTLAPAEEQELIASAAPSESGASIPGVVAAWARRNGCEPEPTRTPVTDDVTVVRYPCPNDADVELYEIAGAGHTWPGSKLGKALEPFVGPTTQSISANAEMWKFFKRHPLRGDV